MNIACSHVQITPNIRQPSDVKEFLSNIEATPKRQLEKTLQELESSQPQTIEEQLTLDVLLGKVAQAKGDVETALAYFEKAEKRIERLSPYFQAARAQLALLHRRYQSAKEDAKAVLAKNGKLPKHLANRMRVLLADIDVLTNNYDGIIISHRELLKKGLGEEEVILLHLAESLKQVGKMEEADDVYRELLEKYPAFAQKHQVEELLARPDFAFPDESLLKRLNTLLRTANHDILEKELKKTKLPKIDDIVSTTQLELQKTAVKARAYTGHYDEAIRYSQKLAEHPNAPDDWLDIHAWALSKADRYEDAAQVWKTLKERTSDSEVKMQSCFYEAFSHFEASLYATSEATWLTCLPFATDAKWKEMTLWYIALAQMLQTNLSQSSLTISQLLDQFGSSPEKPKYLYWKGEVEAHANPTLAKAFWQQAIERFPLHYYSFLSRFKLDLPKIKGTYIEPEALANESKAIGTVWAKDAKLLYQLNMDEDARQLVKEQSTKNDVASLGLLQSVGGFHDVWRYGFYLVPPVPVVGNKLVSTAKWRAHYPMPWYDVVVRETKKRKLPSSFAYAVMHQESGFSPAAVSDRGAIGLMQLRPSTAKQVARTFKLKSPTPSDLKKPHTSIPLGVGLLSLLKNQFNYEYIVASCYNAGEEVTKKWIKQFGNLSPDLFIERIPYKETRHYIKQILTKQAIYDGLQGKELQFKLSDTPLLRP